jgi:hypothetical protein
VRACAPLPGRSGGPRRPAWPTLSAAGRRGQARQPRCKTARSDPRPPPAIEAVLDGRRPAKLPQTDLPSPTEPAGAPLIAVCMTPWHLDSVSRDGAWAAVPGPAGFCFRFLARRARPAGRCSGAGQLPARAGPVDAADRAGVGRVPRPPSAFVGGQRRTARASVACWRRVARSLCRAACRQYGPRIRDQEANRWRRATGAVEAINHKLADELNSVGTARVSATGRAERSFRRATRSSCSRGRPVRAAADPAAA